MTAKTPEPMDAGAPERPVGEPATTRLRACYAAKTLIAEVLDLFPETDYETNTENMRNVQLGVDFVRAGDELAELLRLVEVDPRIASVNVVSKGRAKANKTVQIGFWNRPRTYDLRDPFGLDEAWMVLGDVDDSIEPDWEVGESA